MIGTQLASHIKHPSQALRLKSWVFTALGVLGITWLVARPDTPGEAMNLLFLVQFGIGVLIGGSLTGWRATQLPKTRASEFYLVTPVSDWEIVGGEVLSGMFRTLFVVGAAAPIVALLWGGGWLDASQAAALVCVPCVVGWAVGLGIAVVAYEPLWIRRIFEGLALAGILAYLIAFGLGGRYVVPRLNSLVGYWFGTDLRGAVAVVSPQRLFAVTDPADAWSLARYVAGVCALSLVLCGLAWWRLSVRLRSHYLDELFGEQRSKKDYNQPIRHNPLAWWTARRVSRFRGRVNLYVGWTVILLYALWLNLYTRGLWPQGFGVELMLIFTYLGGAIMLGAGALQFGLVATAFMSGLWDSSVQQRIGRMELLLATPLEPRDFLGGCLAASWTRAKGYLPAAVVVWLSALVAERITPAAFAGLLLLGAVYAAFYFALAFRFFARVAGDRAAATLGMAMSLGIPAFAVGVIILNWGYAAAFCPLSAMYLLGMKPATLEQRFGFGLETLWTVIGVSTLVHLAVTAWLIHDGLAKFETEIRDWFGKNLVPEGTPIGKMQTRAIASGGGAEPLAAGG